MCSFKERHCWISSQSDMEWYKNTFCGACDFYNPIYSNTRDFYLSLAITLFTIRTSDVIALYSNTKVNHSTKHTFVALHIGLPFIMLLYLKGGYATGWNHILIATKAWNIYNTGCIFKLWYTALIQLAIYTIHFLYKDLANCKIWIVIYKSLKMCIY